MLSDIQNRLNGVIWYTKPVKWCNLIFKPVKILLLQVMYIVCLAKPKMLTILYVGAAHVNIFRVVSLFLIMRGQLAIHSMVYNGTIVYHYKQVHVFTMVYRYKHVCTMVCHYKHARPDSIENLPHQWVPSVLRSFKRLE